MSAPLSPGELAQDELTGAAAGVAVHDRLLALTTSAGLKLDVRTLHIRRFNGVAIVFVGFTTGQSATLRIALGRVQALRDELTAVLDGSPNGTEPVRPFTAGDQVYYVLPRSPRHGRPATLYWKARVRKVTDKAVVIVLHAKGAHPRNTVARHLVRHPPEGAWVRGEDED